MYKKIHFFYPYIDHCGVAYVICIVKHTTLYSFDFSSLLYSNWVVSFKTIRMATSTSTSEHQGSSIEEKESAENEALVSNIYKPEGMYSRDSIISTFSIISTVCKIPKWLYYKHSTKVNFRSRKNISTVSIISTVQKISKWLYHKYSTKAIFRLKEKMTSVFYKCEESFEVET